VPELTTEELTLALAVVAGVALIAFLFALFLGLRLHGLRRKYKVLKGGRGDADIVGVMGNAMERVNAVEGRVDSLLEVQKEQAELNRLALQKFYMVRYDAFEEMGGRLSFSAALLDEHGDGLVITSINGRTETRTYAKPVKALNSEHNLSEEEREAIAGAVAAHDRGRSEVSVTR
jgi:hypothetical protein